MTRSQQLPEQLSPHFTLEEATHSQAASRLALPNTPAPAVLEVMRHTASCLEEVRTLLGVPLTVSSWYRSPAVNRAVGGTSRSQHCAGEAVDFYAPAYGTCAEIAAAIASSSVPFDQLILEHSWVHISFKSPPSSNRRQVLTLLAGGGYASGLTTKKGAKL